MGCNCNSSKDDVEKHLNVFKCFGMLFGHSLKVFEMLSQIPGSNPKCFGKSLDVCGIFRCVWDVVAFTFAWHQTFPVLSLHVSDVCHGWQKLIFRTANVSFFSVLKNPKINFLGCPFGVN